MKLREFLQEDTVMNKGFDVRDIEKETIENTNFRKVLYTAVDMQLVLMSLKPGEEIGAEVHPDTDQFFRVEEGEGKVVVNGKDEYDISSGDTVIIKQGTQHNIINTGKKKLSLYSIYSPPHHIDGTIHKTKEDAMKDKEDEMFGEGLIRNALDKKEDYIDGKIEKASGRKRLMLRKQKTQVKRRKKQIDGEGMTYQLPGR